MSTNDKSPFNFDLPEPDDSFSLSDDSDFNFDPPKSTDLIESDEAIADLTDPVRLMECVCPKCTEKTEVDLAQMPEDGFVTTCSSCNKQIHIIRESCACRAKRKSYEINCANCGKLLDQQVHCHSCGASFPDFFVTFNPEDARRKSRNEFISQKWAAIRDFKLSFRPAFNSASQEVKPGYSPERRAFDIAASSSTLSRKFAVLAISLVVAVALVSAGVFAYNSNKAEKKYAENYFKALYCFKTGIDSNLKAFTLLKTDWESAAKTGLKFTPRISSKDETKAGQLRNEADKYMQNMTAEPPKKFAKANESLAKIHAVYLDSETLIASKPNSPQELNNSVEALNKKMIVASQELKANLPDTLKKELEITKLKYRGMKDF